MEAQYFEFKNNTDCNIQPYSLKYLNFGLGGSRGPQPGNLTQLTRDVLFSGVYFKPFHQVMD